MSQQTGLGRNPFFQKMVDVKNFNDSMKNKRQKPPTVANLLANIILPKNDRFFLSGDMDEIYRHILETEGRFTA